MKQTTTVLSQGRPHSHMFGDWAVSFCAQFRSARAAALRSAEDFHELLYVTERLGYFLTCGRENTLGAMRDAVLAIATTSQLTRLGFGPDGSRIEISSLYNMVTQARNDALHQGARARHLTTHAIELALILEDALMSLPDARESHARCVRDYMVREPMVAESWQQLAMIRQIMLTHSFSCLPVWYPSDNGGSWQLLSDRKLAAYLQGNQRMTRLGQSLADAVNADPTLLMPAKTLTPDSSIEEAVTVTENGLLLVVHPADRARLVGVLSAFDLL